MHAKASQGAPPTLGITALVPPEVVYACGWRPVDLNNLVPALDRAPPRRLCAWTAGWREMVRRGDVSVDALAVVAGGDCHNALADGQAAARGRRAHYFFYPFDGAPEAMGAQLRRLAGFLGGLHSRSAWRMVSALKTRLREVDALMGRGEVDAAAAFELLMSGADLAGNLKDFERRLSAPLPRPRAEGRRVALLGVPPIHRDFHRAAADAGLSVVFEELPHEFVRLGGATLRGLADSYATYTFARPLAFRIDFLRRTLEGLGVDGAVHYTQYACHHALEDEALREGLDLPLLTVQGDAPGPTPAGVRLRLEAFAELLGGMA